MTLATNNYANGGAAELTRACAAWIYEHANGLEEHVPMIALIDAARGALVGALRSRRGPCDHARFAARGVALRCPA